MLKKTTAILRKNKGMSLLELLISMAILGLLAVAFASAFVPAVMLEGKAGRLDRNSTTMAGVIEQLMDGGKSVHEVDPGVDRINIVGGSSTTITATFPASGGCPEVTIGQSAQIAQGYDANTGARLESYIPASS